MESGRECLPASGGKRDELRGRCEPVGLQHARVDSHLPKPEEGPETINKVTEYSMPE